MINPLTDKLEELQRLCDEATDGPWRTEEGTLEGFENEDWQLIAGIGIKLCSSNYYSTPGITKEVDAKFIAQSRDAMPKLIQALRIADKNLDRISASDNEVARWATRAKKEIQQILCGGEK